MSGTRSRTRLIVTASLLLCVPLASCYPRLNAGEVREVAAASGHQGQKVCCCGTTDWRCCGMGCCQLPNPKHDKTPTTPNRSDERVQPFGLMLAADPPLVGSVFAGFRRLIESDAGGSNGSSLIALSIRLNI